MMVDFMSWLTNLNNKISRGLAYSSALIFFAIFVLVLITLLFPWESLEFRAPILLGGLLLSAMILGMIGISVMSMFWYRAKKQEATDDEKKLIKVMFGISVLLSTPLLILLLRSGQIDQHNVNKREKMIYESDIFTKGRFPEGNLRVRIPWEWEIKEKLDSFYDDTVAIIYPKGNTALEGIGSKVYRIAT